MVVPLLFGALLNTIDQLHLKPVMNFLKSLGVAKTEEGYYEFLRIGGFSQELFKDSALVLIALFLFCAGSQMNLRVGGAALKKGSCLLLPSISPDWRLVCCLVISLIRWTGCLDFPHWRLLRP